MKIIVAKYSGMCYGVKRALSILDKAVDEYTDSDKNLNTFGPIIHNSQVIEKYEQQGVQVLDDVNIVEDQGIVIRSHGAAKEIYDQAKAHHNEVIDATCLDVRRIQQTVYENHKNGYSIIILGDKNHPEVIGINGWCENSGLIIKTMEEIVDFEDQIAEMKEKSVCLVAQTTFNTKQFKLIVDELEKKLLNINVHNTICLATERRQQSALELSKEVDMMLVIGSKHSSNTKKLFEICREQCECTYHIESKNDLINLKFGDVLTLGIVAGASTPEFLIEDIILDIKKK